jgi:hypothetical protein
MNLQIGSTTFEITTCTRKRDLQKGFYLDLVIPKASIGMDDLYALLDGNTEPIVITGTDGVENVYMGFKEIGGFSLENGSYKVAQICSSEIEAQLSLAQNKVAEQNNVISSMQSVIDTQTIALENHTKVITEQAQTIAEQTATIEAQTEQMAVLEESAVMQTATLESLLLEVIPMVITETVTVAVAEALASNSTTEVVE